MYIINSFQYWKKNKIKYASIVFTVILGIASVLASTYIVRSQKITDLEQTLNNGGFYDFAIYDIDKQVKEEIKKDTRMEHTGSLYDLGSIENRNGVSCTVGAMEDESTEEMVHLSTIEGRYPEKEGEIAVDRISLQCMGVQPRLGIELKVTKKDLDGNEIGEENYVVVGIIEQKYMAENGLIYTRRNYTWDSDDEGYIKIDCPCAYVSIKEKEGYGEKIREHLFANVKVSDEYDDNTIRQELLSKYGSSIRFDYNHFVRSHYADALLGYAAEEDGSLDTASGYNTALERIGSSSTEKDFVSKYVIPIFAILIAVIVFISLYEAFGNFFFSRKREMGIYRCVGMNKLQMVGLLCAELSVVIFPGIIGGVLFGNIAYQGIIQGIKKVFGIRIISAFCVNDYFAPFIDAATPDPYKYSIGLVGLALLLVCIIQIFKSWKLTPLEACNHRRLINKERKKYESLFAINVVILTVAITLGFLYFSTETRYENGLLEEEAKNCLYNGADYMMEKNTEYSFKSTGRELRHDAGVSVENYKKLQNDPSVEETFAAIQCKGIHLVSDKENRKDKFAEFLEEDCIRLEWQEDDPGYDKLKLRYERDRKKAGYTSKEELYHLPICATSQKELENIVETQMDGTLDMAQIKEGKEVVVVYSEGKPPVKVGDLLNMGEVVYPSEQDSSAGFFATGIVENKEPDFIDDYGEQYCVGRRKDFQVKVGAVIHIQDENLWNFYMVENVSKVNLLTTTDGLEKWHLPDENYTKVAVRLNHNADIDKFESQWYQILTTGKIMNMQSLEKIKGEIKQNSTTNFIIFGAMAIMLIIVSILGIVNMLTMHIVSENKRNCLLRALGVSKAGLRWKLMKSQIEILCVGFVLALAGTKLLLCVKAYIKKKTDEYLAGSIELSQDWWGLEFPFHTLSKADYIVSFVVTLVLIVFITFVTFVVFEKKNKNITISDGMKEE